MDHWICNGNSEFEDAIGGDVTAHSFCTLDVFRVEYFIIALSLKLSAHSLVSGVLLVVTTEKKVSSPFPSCSSP